MRRQTSAGAAVAAILALANLPAGAAPGVAGTPDAGPEAGPRFHLHASPAEAPPGGDTDPPADALVSVIHRMDIEMSGLTSLRELLTGRLSFNAFGLQGIAGSGGARYLVDGRAAPGMDLDLFPLSAVDRIEIRRDGAIRHDSSVSGGTINLVLRRRHAGTEVAAGLGRPRPEGGDSSHGSAVWGGELGHGHLVVGVDHLRRQEVRDSEREYSRARWTPGGAFAATTGVSQGGNTLIFVPAGSDTAVSDVLGDCDESVYTGPLTRPPDSRICGYPYADSKWQGTSEFSHHVRRERDSVFLTSDHRLGEDSVFGLRARAARQETLFRYAPSVETFDFTATGIVRDRLIAGSDALTAANFPTDDQVRVAHRFVGHGNRDWRTEYEEEELALSLQRPLADRLGLEAHLQHYRHEAITLGDTFVSLPGIRAAIADGSYDIVNPLSTGADHRRAIRETSVHMVRDTEEVTTNAAGRLKGEALSLPGGKLRWTLGMEIDSEKWREIYDYRDGTGAGLGSADVLGTSDGPSAGDRRRITGLAEVVLPLRAGLEVSLAARQDEYDDLGGATAWRVATRYQPGERLALRAAWDRSAPVPHLATMHKQHSYGFPFVCYTPDGGADLCESIRTDYAGFPGLKPGRSDRFSLGASGRIGPLSLAADWFRIEDSQLPAHRTAQEIVDAHAAGNTPPGVRVEESGGRYVSLVNPLVQTGVAETEGILLRAGAGWTTPWADLALDVHALRTLHSESGVAGDVTQDHVPRHRVHTALQAERGPVALRWSVHHVSATRTETGHYGSWTGHDLAMQWREAMGVEGLRVAAGIRNLTDRGPVTDSGGRSDPVLTLDAVRGRTFFLHFSVSW